MSDILTFNTDDAVNTHLNLQPLPLYDDNHPMLRMVMPEYDISTLPNAHMSNLVKRLKMTMKQYGGIGLSANQCGVQERVFVIGTDDFMITCINPKVVLQSSTTAKDSEGCLSFPGMFLKIDRSTAIEVEFTNENGSTERMTLEGITARCFLHELDHMNGVRFVDRAGPVAIKLAKQRQMKIIKKIKRGMK